MFEKLPRKFASTSRLAQRRRWPGTRTRPWRDVVGDRIFIYGTKLFQFLYLIWGLKVEIRGDENLPRSGGAVLACNHIGFFDYSFISVAARRQKRVIRFLVRRGMFDSRMFGRALTLMRQIPVDRTAGSQSYRAARQLLAQGELIGVFPEGTISRSFMLRPFRAGAAALGVGGRVPIIPIAIWGAHRMATVDGHRTLRRGIAVKLWIGKPIEPSGEWSRPGQQRAQAVLAVEAELHGRMEAMLDKLQNTYPDRPRDEADRWWLPSHLGGDAPDRETGARWDEERMLD